MKITLKQNNNSSKKEIPYFANVQIFSLTVDIEKSFQVPMYKNRNGQDIYRADVCGFEVEGNSPDVVIGLLEGLVPSLVNLKRLPTYVFIARRSHKMFPVYTFRDEVFATTPGGGPIFKHVELAKVRSYLMDYLNEIKVLGTPGKSEKLHVRGVSSNNLSLVRPIFYLKKRAINEGDNEFWAPVFPSSSGEGIYAYAASGRREVELDSAYEVFNLRRQVAQALIADGRLKDEFDLRVDRLLPDYWQNLKVHLEFLPSKLTFNGKKFDMYRAKKKVLALEYREDEDRYSFYAGYSVEEVREQAAKDLKRRGYISGDTEVRIEG